jgi:hypothetical protein
MNAVLAIIADGGRASVVIDREAVENNISHLLYNFIINPSMTASPNFLQRGSRGSHLGVKLLRSSPRLFLLALLAR